MAGKYLGEDGGRSEKMILFADLSTRVIGWAIFTDFGRYVHSGAIDFGIEKVDEQKLFVIGERIREFFENHIKFEKIIIERIPHTRFMNSVEISGVHGIFRYMAFRQGNRDFGEIDNKHWKHIYAGKGNASKEEVAELVNLEIKPKTKFNDETDALAMGLAYFMEKGMEE